MFLHILHFVYIFLFWKGILIWADILPYQCRDEERLIKVQVASSEHKFDICIFYQFTSILNFIFSIK